MVKKEDFNVYNTPFLIYTEDRFKPYTATAIVKLDNETISFKDKFGSMMTEPLSNIIRLKEKTHLNLPEFQGRKKVK